MGQANQRFHQVFVSSTYQDLIPHREKLLRALLVADFFPVGMELWPAENAGVWQTIEAKLANADYYVLIIGGRYGSTNKKGKSFTELEYDLAVKLKIPVVPLIHAAPSTLAVDKSDLQPKQRKRLQQFIDLVSSRHHVGRWTSEHDLAFNVVTALVKMRDADPRPGYVRTAPIGANKPVRGAKKPQEIGLEDMGFIRGSLKDAGAVQHPQTPSMPPFEAGVRAAICQALKSAGEGGIPTGAALLDSDGTVLSLAHNERIQKGSSISHPEMLCIERAGRRNDWHTLTLVSTLSPCIMCTGAIIQHRIPRVVVGENRSYMGREDLLRNDGIEVLVADDPRCVALVREYIGRMPVLWNEDIGGPTA
jgi:cytosine deaminase